MMLDSRTPTKKVQEFLQQQTRFQMLTKSNPEHAKELWHDAQQDADVRFRMYEYLAARKFDKGPETTPEKKKTEAEKSSAKAAD